MFDETSCALNCGARVAAEVAPVRDDVCIVGIDRDPAGRVASAPPFSSGEETSIARAQS